MALPRLLLIATGGTIAGTADSASRTTGYQAGSLAATALLDAIPEVHEQAHFELSQPFSLDSSDMTPSHWLQLAREVAAARSRQDIDGVLITHGTDTLEETAFLLDALLAPGKPVVMTCAMRPASAHSTDGPLNLLHAVGVACHPGAAGLGVLVVANDRIHLGARISKRHTQSVDAFERETSVIGWANPPTIDYQPRAAVHAPELLASLGTLPRVDVLWVGAGSEPDALASSIAHGARAVVLALPGDGSVPGTWREAVGKANARGVAVVRASRTGDGAVSEKANDSALLIAAGTLTPACARVALMLALAGGDAPQRFMR